MKIKWKSLGLSSFFLLLIAVACSAQNGPNNKRTTKKPLANKPPARAPNRPIPKTGAKITPSNSKTNNVALPGRKAVNSNKPIPRKPQPGQAPSKKPQSIKNPTKKPNKKPILMMPYSISSADPGPPSSPAYPLNNPEIGGSPPYPQAVSSSGPSVTDVEPGPGNIPDAVMFEDTSGSDDNGNVENSGKGRRRTHRQRTKGRKYSTKSRHSASDSFEEEFQSKTRRH